MNGLTDEQRKRLSLITSLDDFQSSLILSGLVGILEGKLLYDKANCYTQKDVAQELLNDIDTMIAKSYEKGLYS